MIAFALFLCYNSKKIGRKIMKIVFLDALTLGEDIDLSSFSEIGEVAIYPTTPPELICERVKDSNVVVTNKLKLGKENLCGAKDLELICVTATGFDNIDLEYARSRSIGVCNVVGYSTDSVAQITVASVLALYNSLFDYRRYVSDGSYTESGVANVLTPVYHELEGKIWGIVGFGNIGKRVGRIAEALGCKLLVNKRSSDAEYECVDIDTLCERSDIITVHAPLNDGTREMINAQRINKMKKGVILVNMARGAVTDEKAVADAVKQGRIGGFASDVYSVEPFSREHPFHEIKDRSNVCLTPHMAWGAYEARVRLCDEVKKNIESYLRGEERNRVDK